MQQDAFYTDSEEIRDEAFLRFFRKNYASLCFFANRYMNNPSLAEDVVSDVALKLWEQKQELKNAVSFQSYFYTCVRNACLNRIKKEQAHAKKGADYLAFAHREQQTVLESMIRTETFRQLEAAIDSLPTQCRKVFIKLFIEGKSLAETAEETRLSLSTIKNQRQRGIQLLRNRLGTDQLAILLVVLTVVRN